MWGRAGRTETTVPVGLGTDPDTLHRESINADAACVCVCLCATINAPHQPGAVDERVWRDERACVCVCVNDTSGTLAVIGRNNFIVNP